MILKAKNLTGVSRPRTTPRTWCMLNPIPFRRSIYWSYCRQPMQNSKRAMSLSLVVIKVFTVYCTRDRPSQRASCLPNVQNASAIFFPCDCDWKCTRRICWLLAHRNSWKGTWVIHNQWPQICFVAITGDRGQRGSLQGHIIAHDQRRVAMQDRSRPVSSSASVIGWETRPVLIFATGLGFATRPRGSKETGRVRRG